MSADHPLQTTGRSAGFLRSPLFDIVQFISLLLFLSWLSLRSIENLGYHWAWYQIPPLILKSTADGIQPGPLLLGLGVTLKISALSLVFAFIIGLVTALFRLSHSPVARFIARIYLESSRNTPLLIQLFFIYFVIGPLFGLERFPSAVLALSLFEGAYASEIFRSGILSVDQGQIEAAASLGLKKAISIGSLFFPRRYAQFCPRLPARQFP